MEHLQTQNITVQEAGARGGLTTFAKYGKEHFRSIGRKGQTSLASRVTPQQRRIWGAMGGRPRRHRLTDMGVEEAKR